MVNGDIVKKDALMKDFAVASLFKMLRLVMYCSNSHTIIHLFLQALSVGDHK